MFKRWLKVDPQKSALLIGPRRSGKTTYLKNNFPDFKYSTLDDYDFLSWANNDPKGFIDNLGKQAIIDEIQNIRFLKKELILQKSAKLRDISRMPSTVANSLK